MKKWEEVNLGDIFTAKGEEPYGEIELRPRKHCPVCGAPFEWIGFEGEDKNLLTTEEPVKLLQETHWKTIRVVCPNCGEHKIRL